MLPGPNDVCATNSNARVADVAVDLKPELWSGLPSDLQRMVLETAVRMDRGNTGLKMSLVSKAVHSWVEPVLYEVVTLMDNPSITSFLRTIDEGMVPLARLVKRFAIAFNAMSETDLTPLTPPMLTKCIAACPHIAELMINRPRDYEYTELNGEIIVKLRPDHEELSFLYESVNQLGDLRHLQWNFTQLDVACAKPCISAFANVTHLYPSHVFHPENFPLNGMVPLCECFPALTHIALTNAPADTLAALQALLARPAFHAVVFLEYRPAAEPPRPLFSETDLPPIAGLVDEPRVVSVEATECLLDRAEDCEALWASVDSIIANRMQGRLARANEAR